MNPQRQITTDKREIKDFPELPSATFLSAKRYTLCLRNNGVCEMKRVGEEEIIGKVSS